jgi:hypothetical protein
MQNLKHFFVGLRHTIPFLSNNMLAYIKTRLNGQVQRSFYCSPDQLVFTVSDEINWL